MAALTSQLFNRAQDKKDEQEQLLKLFWNRAELKKEVDKLRRDSLNLYEQVSKQEALTLRVQQRLEQLESQLGNPESAEKAITHYHLRGIWDRCHGRLQSVTRDFAKAQREKEYRAQVADFRRGLNQSLAEIQRESNQVNLSGEMLSEEIRALRELRATQRGIWNFMVRRRLTTEIAYKRETRRGITMRLGELTEDLKSRSRDEPPVFAGLTTEAKRTVNLTAIACAQELYLHFEPDDLAKLSREASARQPGDTKYGDRRDCRELRRNVESKVQLLESDSTITQRVQLRARYLRSNVEYRNETDTVPVSGSLCKIALIQSDGKANGAKSLNILAEEYWDLFSVLLS